MNALQKPRLPLLAALRAMLAIGLLAMLAGSCSPTKRVPKGKQLLIRNEVFLDGKKAADSKPLAIIKQKPNKKLEVPVVNWVVWRPYLQLYNSANPKKEKGFSNWLRKIGEAPTVLDSALMLNSARQIGMYYFNNGYFLNQVEVQVEYVRDSTRAICTYNVFAGPRYYFGGVDYFVSNVGISKIIAKESGQTLIENGKPYNAATLEDERTRLVTILRNSGYYGYPKNLIRFESDTSAGNHTVGVRMIITDQPAAIGDSVFYIEMNPYKLRHVYINPSHNFGKPPVLQFDTLDFMGLKLLQENPPKYTPTFLESSIHFKTDELYNETKVRETYAHLTGNRIFQIAEISFEPVVGDSTNRLDAFVVMQPLLKRTFTSELEGTTTAGNYGLRGVLTLASRNIFHGGEILDLSLKGGVEAQVNVEENNIFNTFEVGTELGLNFPRFFLFGQANRRIPKRMEPSSRLYTSYSYQTRVEFERTILAVGLLYNWRESRTKMHQINLVDFNYVRLPRIDQDYLNSLEFKTGFQDNLIAATRYTFIYDNQKYTKDRQAQFFKASVETSGNMLAAINGPGNFEQDPDTEQYLLLGVPFSQYVKVDFDFRNYTHLSQEHMIATRLFFGTTYSYGNTPYLPPFEKSFLAGGSNDMRGWVAYRLGPGNFPKELYTANGTSYAAVAPIKLMASFEYRFPIIKSIKSAIFFDAGNIWLYDRPYDTSGFSDVEKALVEYGLFKLDTFYKQLALNTGLGIRYDFGFFALRLDMGIRIFDPTEAENQRYVLPGLKWSTINYNIAIGYPF